MLDNYIYLVHISWWWMIFTLFLYVNDKARKPSLTSIKEHDKVLTWCCTHWTDLTLQPAAWLWSDIGLYYIRCKYDVCKCQLISCNICRTLCYVMLKSIVKHGLFAFKRCFILFNWNIYGWNHLKVRKWTNSFSIVLSFGS